MFNEFNKKKISSLINILVIGNHFKNLIDSYTCSCKINVRVNKLILNYFQFELYTFIADYCISNYSEFHNYSLVKCTLEQYRWRTPQRVSRNNSKEEHVKKNLRIFRTVKYYVIWSRKNLKVLVFHSIWQKKNKFTFIYEGITYKWEVVVLSNDLFWIQRKNLKTRNKYRWLHIGMLICTGVCTWRAVTAYCYVNNLKKIKELWA